MEIQSMTGYGEAEEGGFRVEIRSVNHRFLDIHFKMPKFLSPYEMDLRALIKEEFSRGRLDISINLTEKADLKIAINENVARQILTALDNIQQSLLLEEPPSLNHLFWFRDAVFIQEPELDSEELFNAFRKAMDKVKEMRISEGRHLVKDIMELLRSIEQKVEEIESKASDLLNQKYNSLKERLQELLKEIEIDHTRLIQEASFLAERADIREEITRLKSHLKQMERILTKGGIIGRKVDFLLQEMFREVNTIGSKSSEYEISNLVVKIKSDIEKIREQVQNIQ